MLKKPKIEILLMFSSVLSKDIKNVKNPKVENSPTQPALECPTENESWMPEEILISREMIQNIRYIFIFDNFNGFFNSSRNVSS